MLFTSNLGKSHILSELHTHTHHHHHRWIVDPPAVGSIPPEGFVSALHAPRLFSWRHQQRLVQEKARAHSSRRWPNSASPSLSLLLSPSLVACTPFPPLFPYHSCTSKASNKLACIAQFSPQTLFRFVTALSSCQRSGDRGEGVKQGLSIPNAKRLSQKRARHETSTYSSQYRCWASVGARMRGDDRWRQHSRSPPNPTPSTSASTKAATVIGRIAWSRAPIKEPVWACAPRTT